ncbi:MAG TPA: hypothetical protein PLA85_01325 [Micropepsaceae bacterium]|nr:hypothetical protein [Micropepsaceae bacterium]
MRMFRLVLAAAAAFVPATAFANAPPPLPEMEVEPVWDVSMDGVLTLHYGADGGVAISCAEGAGQLRISIVPDWEIGYGKEDGTIFEGPVDIAVVRFGDKPFEASLAPKSPEDAGPVYLLPADADTVSAIMLATNASVELKSDGQLREGTPDTQGAFDMFATTCAQINGLR